MLTVCTDITHIMVLEKKTQAIRTHFFSSVAHELRTPLNSMIPVLKIILDMLANHVASKINNSSHKPIDVPRI